MLNSAIQPFQHLEIVPVVYMMHKIVSTIWTVKTQTFQHVEMSNANVWTIWTQRHNHFNYLNCQKQTFELFEIYTSTVSTIWNRRILHCTCFNSTNPPASRIWTRTNLVSCFVCPMCFHIRMVTAWGGSLVVCLFFVFICHHMMHPLAAVSPTMYRMHVPHATDEERI